MNALERYARIDTKFPREFCLLQGTGCRWKHCTFCDYHTDISGDPFAVNEAVLAQVTGTYGVLDIINSGSCTELDEQTLARIAEVVREKSIHTLWFEAHYRYRNDLPAFASQFPNTTVKFRTGIETFDGAQRETWQKGVPASVTVADVAKYFDGVCLLFAVEGQNREAVSRDITLALAHFEYASVNAFVANSTPLQRDENMVDWFCREWQPVLANEPKVEILLHNTDLGVG